MRAFYFPSGKETFQVVRVPSLDGVDEIRSLNDLDLSSWWTYPLGKDELLVCLEDYRYYVDYFPPESRLRLKRPYSVCWEGKVRVFN